MIAHCGIMRATESCRLETNIITSEAFHVPCRGRMQSEAYRAISLDYVSTERQRQPDQRPQAYFAGGGRAIATETSKRCSRCW